MANLRDHNSLRGVQTSYQLQLHKLLPETNSHYAKQLRNRSLHLKHCKMSAKVTYDLLHSFNVSKNSIRSLSLVNVNLNQSNYKELCALIQISRHLQVLDISWNGLRCHSMYELVDVIADNRSLQDLNLSFNNFHDSY